MKEVAAADGQCSGNQSGLVGPAGLASATSLDFFNVRDGRESDLGFITNSWRESLYIGAPAVQQSDREHYKREMGRVFSKLLPTATVRVACDPSDEDTLLGFAVATGPELHYVYVRGGDEKVSMRKLGVARKLIESLDGITSYTFRTLAGERRLKPRDRGWKFTPRFTI